MSFGRKGLAPGQVAPAGPGGFGRAQPTAPATPAHTDTRDADEIAALREAFIASERARRADEIGEGSLPHSSGDLDSMRNSARPAARLTQPAGAGQFGETGLPAQRYEQTRSAAPAPRARSSYFFGDPASRSLGIAYLIWFVIGQTGLHRAYCGSKDSAIIQVSLLVVSLVCLFIFPPIGLVGLVAWMCWLIGDLFMMPGMLRRFQQAHDYSRDFESARIRIAACPTPPPRIMVEGDGACRLVRWGLSEARRNTQCAKVTVQIGTPARNPQKRGVSSDWRRFSKGVVQCSIPVCRARICPSRLHNRAPSIKAPHHD